MIANVRKLMDPGDILESAATYMSAHGKTVDAYEDDNGAVCAEGAIFRVVNPDAAECDSPRSSGLTPGIRALEALTGWLQENYNPEWSTVGAVVSWSDDHDRETVVNGMRAASRWYRGQHADE
jgi:hypothetical protein